MREAAEKAIDINSFFKELKLHELMTSQSLDEMSNILVPILTHLKKLNSINTPKEKYDHKRIYQLIEVLSKDIANQMYKILSDENMMFSSFNNFKQLY